MTCSYHPVGGQLDVRQLFDARGRQVGQRLPNGHAPAGGGIEQGERCALTDRHGLAHVALVTGRRDGDVGHRYLPGANHLIAAHQTGHAAIPDRNQKRFVRHRRQPQHPLRRVRQLDRAGFETRRLAFDAPRFTQHLRGFTKEHGHLKINRRAADVVSGEKFICQHQSLLFRRRAEHRDRTTLPRAHGLKSGEPCLLDRQYIAFLRFVTPELHRRHARLRIRHGAQLQARPSVRPMHELRQGV